MSQSRVTQYPFDLSHRLDAQLRFNDYDLLGHLNNNVYLQLMDLAKYRYFQAVMGADFDISRLAVVVVNINCDFIEPATVDEPLTVCTATEAIGEKSLTLVQRILNPATGHVKCQATTVMASFDTKTMRSAPIADDARRAVAAYEGREF